MSRHVVPVIVFVTLAIMFGSSFLTQFFGAQLRQKARADTELAGRSHVSAPWSPGGE